MTPMQKQALQYVKNTGGCATVEHFIEDHEPVGKRLWEDLDFADVVAINDDGKIIVLPKGEDLLNT